MQNDTVLPTLSDFKIIAKLLNAITLDDTKLSKILILLSNKYGYSDWNIIKPKLAVKAPSADKKAQTDTLLQYALDIYLELRCDPSENKVKMERFSKVYPEEWSIFNHALYEDGRFLRTGRFNPNYFNNKFAKLLLSKEAKKAKHLIEEQQRTEYPIPLIIQTSSLEMADVLNIMYCDKIDMKISELLTNELVFREGRREDTRLVIAVSKEEYQNLSMGIKRNSITKSVA